ncbi:MAG: hypothetical protein II077_08450, partial [Treponema sp.]|nr:hypothetical protein [Treponema sp.]
MADGFSDGIKNRGISFAFRSLEHPPEPRGVTEAVSRKRCHGSGVTEAVSRKRCHGSGVTEAVSRKQ